VKGKQRGTQYFTYSVFILRGENTPASLRRDLHRLNTKNLLTHNKIPNIEKYFLLILWVYYFYKNVINYYFSLTIKKK